MKDHIISNILNEIITLGSFCYIPILWSDEFDEVLNEMLSINLIRVAIEKEFEMNWNYIFLAKEGKKERRKENAR